MAVNGDDMRVGVIITTHNRLTDLQRTLAKLATLSPEPAEIWVCADGCNDGTVAWLKTAYPTIKVIRHETSQGSVASRNELMRECACDVLLSLDDDSYPIELDCVSRLHSMFRQSPRMAVATFPQRTDEFPESLTETTFGQTQFVASYVSSAAAIRREAFLELGGYPAFFFHAYEEPDFALRCVAAGWQVRFEPSLTIRHHYTSVGRNEIRTHHRHARNELWSVILRCPFPGLLVVAPFRVLRQAGYACRRGLGWLVQEPKWWLASLTGVSRCLALRTPVSWQSYYRWMRLMKRPLENEPEWEVLFGSRLPHANPKVEADS